MTVQKSCKINNFTFYTLNTLQIKFLLNKNFNIGLLLVGNILHRSTENYYFFICRLIIGVHGCLPQYQL